MLLDLLRSSNILWFAPFKLTGFTGKKTLFYRVTFWENVYYVGEKWGTPSREGGTRKWVNKDRKEKKVCVCMRRWDWVDEICWGAGS